MDTDQTKDNATADMGQMCMLGPCGTLKAGSLTVSSAVSCLLPPPPGYSLPRHPHYVFSSSSASFQPTVLQCHIVYVIFAVKSM